MSSKEAHKKEATPRHPHGEEIPALNPDPEKDAAPNETIDAARQLGVQVAELKDRLLRGQAEWDNSRKRILKEKEDAVRYAGEALLERLLPVLDNFEMGIQAAKSTTDAKAIAQGFEMALAQFQQVLREAGVEPIDAVGHPFDPHRHEALGNQESTEHPEGHVLSQIRKGYKLKDRLLRPASVFVAKAPEDEASSKAESK
jgi:molecular chaperone GrpE